jgi:hypothetical protein
MLTRPRGSANFDLGMIDTNQPRYRSVYRLPGARMFGAYFILAFGVLILVSFVGFPLSSQNRSMAGEYPWLVLLGFLFFDMGIFVLEGLLIFMMGVGGTERQQPTHGSHFPN